MHAKPERQNRCSSEFRLTLEFSYEIGNGRKWKTGYQIRNLGALGPEASAWEAFEAFRPRPVQGDIFPANFASTIFVLF